MVRRTAWGHWTDQRLSPTQLGILQLLDVRGGSLSLSAAALELGIKPSTASDSVAALDRKGLISKERSSRDFRTLALDLTEKGSRTARRLGAQPDPLCQAFDALAPNERETLYVLSIKMLHHLQRGGVLPVSRTCVRCKFFLPFRYSTSATPHHCGFARKSFAASQLPLDCSVFEAGDEADQAATWKKFAGEATSG
jgi:DNA-binding MarR family transcriptional regulator